jgi:polygalacturonase
LIACDVKVLFGAVSLFDLKQRRLMMVVYFVVLLLTLVQVCSAQSVVSVTSLGAHSDGTNSAATTAAFQAAFANNSNGQILIPPGSYLIDNSTGPLTINGFSGKLLFQGSAQLVFTNNTNGGLLFEGGSGAVITGLHATYAIPPAFRNSPNEEIKFSGTVNTVLMDAVVQNSPAAGILFYGSINPNVVNATVINSLADGLNFSNCQNAQVTKLVTRNTGDDGLAFVNYTRYPNLIGGLAQNIVITNSKARGIAVAGQSNVTVNGFQIHNTSSSGVLVAQDTFNGTRIPANVHIEDGTIYSAGTLGPLVGNQYGIEYNAQESVTFTNISVFAPGNNGLSGTSPGGSVTVKNVAVHSPLTGLGFLFYQTQKVQVTDSSADNTPSYGFLALQSSQVTIRGLKVTDAGLTDPLKRAVWFEDAGTILASSIDIVSDAGAANIIGCYARPGYPATSGSVKILTSTVITGKSSLSMRNSCPNVIFSP